MKIINIVFSIFLLIFTVGCNPFIKHYQGLEHAHLEPGYIPSSKEIEIKFSSDIKRDAYAKIRESYFLVGQSNFIINPSYVSIEQIKEQASRIGAEVVLVSEKYRQTVTGSMPLLVPDSKTSHTDIYTSTNTPYGVLNTSGVASTTTYGTKTINMPYRTSVNEYHALFFAKYKYKWGFYVDELDNQDRERLHTNTGVKIVNIVNNTPFFNARIFIGDVILKINDQSIYSTKQFKKIKINPQITTMDLTINRNGKIINKTVSLVSPPTEKKIQ